MRKLIQFFYNHATRRKLAFVSIRALIGVFLSFVGFSLMPRSGNLHSGDRPPAINFSLIPQCRDRYQEVLEYSKVYVKRIDSNKISVIIDFFGVFDNLVTKSADLGNLSLGPELYFSGLTATGVTFSDQIRTLSKSAMEACDQIRVSWDEDPAKSVVISPTAMLRMHVVDSGPPKLAPDPADWGADVVYEPEISVKFEKFRNSQTDKVDIPISKSIGGVRLELVCETCVRGSGNEMEIGFSSVAGLYTKPEIFIHSSLKYLARTWGQDDRINGHWRTLRGQSANSMNPIYFSWNDIGAEQRVQTYGLLSGVILGIGLTLIAEYFIALLDAKIKQTNH